MNGVKNPWLDSVRYWELGRLLVEPHPNADPAEVAAYRWAIFRLMEKLFYRSNPATVYVIENSARRFTFPVPAKP